MNKIICAIVLALSFLSFSNVALAVEGTCSWHDGVNCSAGSDWDGSTVCNDGWRDSTELYSQTKECGVRRPLCTSDELKQLETKYGVPDIEQKLKVISDKITQLSQSPQGSSDTSILRINAINSLNLSSEFSTVNAEYSNSENRALADCYVLGAKEEQQFISDLYGRQQAQTLPQYTCPANLILNGDKCVCGDGLFFSGSSCVNATQICQSKLGPNSFGDLKQCYCSSGYSYDSSSKSCVQAGPQMSNDERCVALKLGLFYNTDKQSCDTCPAETEKDPNSSSCRIPPKLAPTKALVIPTIPAPALPKPKIISEKPKTVATEKHTEVLSITTPQVMSTATATDQIAPTITEHVAAVVEEVKTPLPPTLKPKPFWSRIVSWFKFW